MKRLLFVFMLAGLSACEFYYPAPLYDERTRISGSHDVDEYSETYNTSTFYTIRIGCSGSYDQIYIDNFYGVGIRVYATFRNNKIEIYRQLVDGYEVEGVGTVYGDEIEFNYRVKDTYSYLRSDYCEATAWRY